MKKLIICLVGAMLILNVLGCGTMVLAQTAKAAGETKLLLDFEDSSIWMSENDNPFKVQKKHVSQGAGSLFVNYTNKPKWSNVIAEKIPADWSGFRYMNFDLYLEGEDAADFAMWVRDKGQHKAIENFQIGPGWNTCTVDLDKMNKTSGFERGSVIALCLYKASKAEFRVHLDNMYLSKQRPVQAKAEPVRTPDKELITNGGFEKTGKPDELGNPFTWWIAKRWEGASFLGQAKTGVNTGKSALMLDGRGRCKIGVYSPIIKVKGPTKVKLTAYFQSKNLKRAGGSISITDAAEKPLSGGAAKIQSGSRGWQKAEIVCDVPPKCTAIKVFAQLFDQGLVWIDDISLTGVDLTAKNGISISDTGRELKADAPIVTETPEILERKKHALEAVAELKAVITKAKAAGKETLYAEIPLMLGKLAFDIRWDHPDHLELREEYCSLVQSRCNTARTGLEAVLAGKAADLKVPPHPKVKDLKLDGAYYRENGKPKIIFSMQYHNKGELTKWFIPGTYRGSMPAVGASRYNFKQTPIWKLYQANKETHRVYDNGWCGHIIRDQFSAGGSDQCVINLDHPEMLKAIAQTHAEYYKPRVERGLPYLYINLGFEYSYRNHDKYSRMKFQKWLKDKHSTIDKLNAIWKTELKSFDEVTCIGYAPGHVEPNPAKRYDWFEFNLWRFTDFMIWGKKSVAKHFPGIPTTTGGGSPFGAGFGAQGLDEEELADNHVCDIWLSETGSRALGVTSVMDLQRSLVPNKVILDPEYHAMPNTCFLMFLHGCGIMDYWWWPGNPGQFYASSMKHSHLRSLDGVAAVMETALDVRRLPEYIAPFPAAPPEIALLYPRASLIQKFPAAQGNKTMFTFETEKTYAAAVRLDTPVGFASSKRIMKGGLSKYKVLAVPGARFVKEEVFSKIVDYVKEGGTLLITPTSFVADEYSRRQDYLKQIGIEVTAEELPEFLAGEAKRGIDQEPGELDFIQGPIAVTKVSKEPQCEVLMNGQKLNAAGVIQTIKASPEWKVVGKTGKDAAVLERPLGKGKITYFAVQLDVIGRRIFLDKLMDDLKFDRPVRVFTPEGEYPDGIESRTVAQDGYLLTYLHNTLRETGKVKLVSKRKIKKITNLNEDKQITSPIVLGPFETIIMKIETE